MSDAVLTEISTALGDIVAHLDGKGGDATADRLLEVSTALGDMVAAMEARQALDLAPLVAAVKGLQLSVAAPAVQVDVHTAPAQVIVQQPSGRVVKIKFKTDNYGHIESADLVWSQPETIRATPRKPKD